MPLSISVRSRKENRIPADPNSCINAEMRDAIQTATRAGQQIARALTPKRRPHTYTTIEATVVGGGNHVEGHFGSNDEIMRFLEEGTRPHVIEPRSKQALYWPGASHPVRHVDHPGTRALHIIERSGELAGTIAKGELDRVFPGCFG